VSQLYILDTHVFLWMNVDRARLGSAIDIIANPKNELLLSAAVSWEIAIKAALGRLPIPGNVPKWIADRMRATKCTPLDIMIEHTVGAGSLPTHHGDPFDRLLIAQALFENLPIITADKAFDDYDVDLVRI
jgi:PIN domain nuclease of toxin-antitoxin system